MACEAFQLEAIPLPSATRSPASIEGSQIGIDKAGVRLGTKFVVSGSDWSLFGAVVNGTILTVIMLIRGMNNGG